MGLATVRDISGAINSAGPRRKRNQGFTLIEMVVVVAIILVMLGVVLPGATAIWEQRKVADAQTLISGLLKTSRARAVRPSGLESGLFFFVDASGAQGVVPIEQDPHCLDPLDPTIAVVKDHEGVACQNVFRVTAERAQTLPPPMRVMPRYAVEPATTSTGTAALTFSDDERASNDLLNPPSGSNQAQRQRNHFAVVYSSQGQLLVRRDVLIRDPDRDKTLDTAGKPHGDVTGLRTGMDTKDGVKTCHTADDLIEDVDPVGVSGAGKRGVHYLLVDNAEVALTFVSVDGLLVYDDSLFNALPAGPERREWLIANAQPFYVSRLTGAVVRGPLKENE